MERAAAAATAGATAAMRTPANEAEEATGEGAVTASTKPPTTLPIIPLFYLNINLQNSHILEVCTVILILYIVIV